MFGFLKRKRDSVEIVGTACLWCRGRIPAENPGALLRLGAVFEPAAGWFCSSSCAAEYRLRFHLDSSSSR
jgi:hypothetical protein